VDVRGRTEENSELARRSRRFLEGILRRNEEFGEVGGDSEISESSLSSPKSPDKNSTKDPIPAVLALGVRSAFEPLLGGACLLPFDERWYFPLPLLGRKSSLPDETLPAFAGAPWSPADNPLPFFPPVEVDDDLLGTLRILPFDVPSPLFLEERFLALNLNSFRLGISVSFNSKSSSFLSSKNFIIDFFTSIFRFGLPCFLAALGSFKYPFLRFINGDSLGGLRSPNTCILPSSL